jgi:hypothetical protein
MTRHHQTDEVIGALGQHQLVVFVGARGTGKTRLIKDVEEVLTSRGMAVLVLNAEAAQASTDLLVPIAVVLGCKTDQLTASHMPGDLRLRVLVDNCDALHQKTWFPAVQDQWRGLLGESQARGRVGVLLCGRPLFRRVAEGRGSPLVGIGTFVPSRPLTREEIETILDVAAATAEKTQTKTGGHPQLSHRLVDQIHGDLSELESRYVEFVQSQRRFVLQLIDDHGEGTRAALADMLDCPRGSVTAESAILARHFRGARMLGEDVLNDLVSSGLIKRVGESLALSAEMLRTDRDLRKHLGTPSLDLDDEPSVEYVEAAAWIFRIENRLRLMVGHALAEIDEMWWPSRFPPAMIREVEQRRQTESDSPVPVMVDIHPIAYLNFGELVDAVVEETNWRQVFRVRFGMTREAFNQTSATITVVRNKVAHNRPVSTDDLVMLRLSSERLGLSG